ncbi:MAG TPA: hypothetical protein VGW80_02895 [Solirubrobacterales bacterium]|jgi:hypothetical protein|nr:hypothetical protein [Solirubrobacterales bacterium]
MKAKRLLPLLCATVVLLALPAGANAEPNKVYPGRYLLEIDLPDSNGWEMSIAARDHERVYLVAQRGFASVTYSAPGRVSSERVEADFGSLGRIDLQLDLEARGTGVPRLHGRCSGRSPFELVGRFHGTVDFPGEPNVARASVQRGHATITRTFQHVCRPAKSAARGKDPLGLGISVLGARSHENGRTTSFEAAGISIEDALLLGVVVGGVRERIGEVNVARSRSELVFEDEMHFSRRGAQPERVQVKPPKPFLGSASYLKAAGEPPRWAGDLRVRVPGGGLVALAGPNFDGTLCRPRLPQELAQCLPRVRELRGAAPSALLDLYGSGSHSQPLALARLSSLR